VILRLIVILTASSILKLVAAADAVSDACNMPGY